MDTFASYILGDKVSLIQIPNLNGHGMTELNPPWQVVLSYEFALRRAAFKMAFEEPATITIASALALVVKDPELKEPYFTGALALAGKRAAPSLAPGAAADQWSR